MALIPLEEPTTKRIPPDTFSLWALAFRPFYLLAAAFAVLAIPVWAVVFSGGLQTPIPGMWWHAHEMIFGFAVAVIIGFLFTAGRNWTGLDTPAGGQLAVLAGLWLAGRLAMAFGSGAWVAVVDIAFLPVAAALLLRVLVRAKSRRNYFVGVLPGLLALANLVFHLAVLQVIDVDPLTAMHLALGLIVVLETIIGGRVIPMFTFNSIRGIKQWRDKRVDWAAAIATGIALLLWATGAGTWAAAVSFAAAVLQGLRVGGWNPWATRKVSLLWVLHLSYMWIPLGLALIGLAQLGLLPRTAGIHALAIGATGGLIIGMITRTALGHTGRMLVAGPIETAAYALVQLAALARVLTVAVIPAAAIGGIHAAATLWSLGFLLYLWRYTPFLLKARVDGKEG
ncbi:NnrS family protein [Thauera linaloolentis]|uniref:NnrS family protein n=1 Tax=Thauera linaloolentis (strain DSM 12138 / JCM 21573 / CCUG 41526 / CIP 105981 / IAM 15112 / NBRC 102519 / 47Lol) TaxID=1123367 RepID=N6Y6W6_THAL4|nr:NnrS family protein [Thauera linaloolentis]ENO89956.1 NnrS family protein [Thauera linaloolentis 47Lol = DSM 12138]MCM8566617.1 NnrS family protein [Thauera linaloolentis]